MNNNILIVLSVLFFFSIIHSQEYSGWQVIPPITEDLKTLNGLYFFNKDSGWVCGYHRPDRSYTFLASTIDEGDNWETMQVGQKTSLHDVNFVNDSIGYCLDGDVLKTLDAGSTWQTVLDDIGGDLKRRIKFYDEKYGWAVGSDSTIVKTIDGGETWQYITVDNLAVSTIFDLSVVDSLVVIINTFDSVHKSNDGGITWSVIRKTNLLFQTFFDVEFVSVKKGWIVGSLGTILYTDDGGSTWQDQSFNWDDEVFENIDAFDSLTALAVTNLGAIYRTDDGGNNWIEQVPRESLPKLTTVQMIDKLSAYAVGFQGTILKITNGGVTWLNENPNNEMPQSYILYPAYPNPFNPSTTIQYHISELSFVTLKIYDVLGREIATLVNEEKPTGNYEVEFDGSKLSSGIYFYRLQAGSFVETKKMVLIK